MEFQEVQGFGAAIHFWPNGAGPKFWGIFQEALFAEWVQGHLEKYPADKGMDLVVPSSLLPRGIIPLYFV